MTMPRMIRSAVKQVFHAKAAGGIGCTSTAPLQTIEDQLLSEGPDRVSVRHVLILEVGLGVGILRTGKDLRSETLDVGDIDPGAGRRVRD